MRKLIVNICIFLTILLIILEILIRFSHLTIDIPRRTIDSDGVQKYIPNQKGYWLNGTHQWEINQLGWPGPAPKKFNNLITLIGDSHIENLMNDTNCHQAILLKQLLPEYNFLQVARSGASLIEFLEFYKSVQKHYSPIYNIVYVKSTDFKESIVQLGKKNDVTQLDINKREVINGELKAPLAKFLLYNFKTLYYFKNDIEEEYSKQKIQLVKHSRLTSEIDKQEYSYYSGLLEYITTNYKIDNLIFVFHPDTNVEIVKLAKDSGINAYLLSSGNSYWGVSETDIAHWNCEGHKSAAEQVRSIIMQDFLIEK